ncbi:MAG: CHAT domain-containing protein [Gammaproteobacteria bacterium]|nr:CHAT domain-containing protein [Gammaproteobacteria bacterium]
MDAEASDPIIVSNPDFDRGDLSAVLARFKEPPDFYFVPLPRSAEEGERVSARVGGAVLSGAQATTTALRAVKSPGVLHLATHGYFLPAFGRGLSVIGNWRTEGYGLALRGDVLASDEEPLLRSGLALIRGQRLVGGQGRGSVQWRWAAHGPRGHAA